MNNEEKLFDIADILPIQEPYQFENNSEPKANEVPPDTMRKTVNGESFAQAIKGAYEQHKREQELKDFYSDVPNDAYQQEWNPSDPDRFFKEERRLREKMEQNRRKREMGNKFIFFVIMLCLTLGAFLALCGKAVLRQNAEQTVSNYKNADKTLPKEYSGNKGYTSFDDIYRITPVSTPTQLNGVRMGDFAVEFISYSTSTRVIYFRFHVDEDCRSLTAKSNVKFEDGTVISDEDYFSIQNLEAGETYLLPVFIHMPEGTMDSSFIFNAKWSTSVSPVETHLSICDSMQDGEHIYVQAEGDYDKCPLFVILYKSGVPILVMEQIGKSDGNTGGIYDFYTGGANYDSYEILRG